MGGVIMRLVGFCGDAGAGKSTAARILEEEHGFVILPFAGPMKAMALAFGLSKDEVFNSKETPPRTELPEKMSTVLAKKMLTRLVPIGRFYASEQRPLSELAGLSGAAAVASLVDWYDAERESIKTPRHFLQKLGTEWGRERISDNVWIDAWKRDALQAQLEAVADACDSLALLRAVADDVRFENEAAAIRKEGGLVIEITRAGAGSASGAGHASEAGVVPDITIANDGSEEDLSREIMVVLARAGT
jgi:hypothetical protein